MFVKDAADNGSSIHSTHRTEAEAEQEAERLRRAGQQVRVTQCSMPLADDRWAALIASVPTVCTVAWLSERVTAAFDRADIVAALREAGQCTESNYLQTGQLQRAVDRRVNTLLLAGELVAHDGDTLVGELLMLREGR